MITPNISKHIYYKWLSIFSHLFVHGQKSSSTQIMNISLSLIIPLNISCGHCYWNPWWVHIDILCCFRCRGSRDNLKVSNGKIYWIIFNQLVNHGKIYPQFFCILLFSLVCITICICCMEWWKMCSAWKPCSDPWLVGQVDLWCKEKQLHV